MNAFLRSQIAKALLSFRQHRNDRHARHHFKAEVIARRQMLAAFNPKDPAAHGRLVGRMQPIQ